MQKAQIRTEEHHRRPRSLGGTNNPSNISYVRKREHTAWHVFVGNMNAYQICGLLNQCKQKPKNMQVVCRFINGQRVTKKGHHNSKNGNKCEKAWKVLFKNMTFKEALAYINNVWLDPSYHFYLRRERKSYTENV